MRSSGVNAGSKSWIMAPLSVQPSAIGVAAMPPFLAHWEPSRLTVQMAKGSFAALRAANAILSPFQDTDGWRMSAVAAESPAQAVMRLLHAPDPVTAPAASTVTVAKQRSDEPWYVAKSCGRSGGATG